MVRNFFCEEFASNHKCCSVRQRALNKDIIKLMFSLSQELYDSLPPTLQVCTKMYMYDKKKQTEHDTLIEDYNFGNNILPTNCIENTDINDPEVINKNNIINDDVINHTTNITQDSMFKLLDNELFETNSISTQNIQEEHRQTGWIKS